MEAGSPHDLAIQEEPSACPNHPLDWSDMIRAHETVTATPDPSLVLQYPDAMKAQPHGCRSRRVVHYARPCAQREHASAITSEGMRDALIDCPRPFLL
jgi:hypothetical protein